MSLINDFSLDKAHPPLIIHIQFMRNSHRTMIYQINVFLGFSGLKILCFHDTFMTKYAATKLRCNLDERSD